MWGWLVQSGRSCLGFPVRRVLLYQSLKMIKNKTDLSIKHAGLEKLSGPVTAVVISLNRFMAPVDDTVTAQKCSTKH